MLYTSSKALLAIWMVTSLAFGFEDQACVNAQFDTTVIHKAFPLGLAKNSLQIKKQDCLLVVTQTKYKFFKQQWNVDICRTPVHIKKGAGSVEVLKRQQSCQNNVKKEDAFCHEFVELTESIQDAGLIFAEGDRENLTDAHGQVYCAYLLLNKHLGEGLVFSRNEKYYNIFKTETRSNNPGATPANEVTPLPNNPQVSNETSSKTLIENPSDKNKTEGPSSSSEASSTSGNTGSF